MPIPPRLVGSFIQGVSFDWERWVFSKRSYLAKREVLSSETEVPSGRNAVAPDKGQPVGRRDPC